MTIISCDTFLLGYKLIFIKKKEFDFELIKAENSEFPSCSILIDIFLFIFGDNDIKSEVVGQMKCDIAV